jgi:ComEC/Rec2-related protein
MMAWRAAGLAIGLIAGIVIAAEDISLSTLYMWVLATLGAAATGAGIMAERRWTPWPKIAVAAAAFACALPLGYLRTMDVIGTPTEGSLRYLMQSVEPGTQIAARGHINAEPDLRGAGELDVYMRVREVRIGDDDDAAWTPVTRGRILVRAFSRANNAPEVHEFFNRLAAPAAYGWEIEASAPYRPIDPPLNPGEFDYAYFLGQSGVDVRLRTHVSEVAVLEEARGNPIMALALTAKTSFLETFKSTVRSPASRLTSAATLGARRAVENIDFRGQDLATTLRHAGVGHVLAVSGLHVSVIAVMLFALFRMTGAKPKQFVPILIIFLILFALLTGARPSSVRAVIMNSVVLIAIAYLRSGFRTATVIGLSLSSFFILIRNPTVLFAASFLLSYGAVLSLIVIAPPLDRIICKVRGFSLFFAAIWFALLLRLAGWHLPWLIHPPNLIAYLGFLWMLILIGTWLNNRFPAMWRYTPERIPALVRLFFAAQLAIQFGMMIPMSAWFFGLFPVAGVLVNLLAIPAVGVLVQLGMLTGLIGMVPVIGAWLAIPFGAAATLTGDGFIWLAYIGSSVFPYPATPMPSRFWMIAYYVALAGVLALEGNRHILLGWLYRFIPPGPANMARRIGVAVIPAVMILLPVLDRAPAEPELREMRILAQGRYPIVVLTGEDSASLINAGDRFTGGRLVFDSLRQKGSVRVDAAILPSSEPRAGITGIPELLDRIPVSTSLLGILPAPGETMPEAIGDSYLIRQAAEGRFWAVNIEQGFERLREAADECGMALVELRDDTLPVWRNARFRVLPLLEQRPQRYVSSAMTPILQADIHGLEWIFITDTTPDALFTALADTTSCDVMVVPNLSTFQTYGRWLRTALIRTRPGVLIIAGDSVIDDDQLISWLPHDPNRIVIQTGREGAVNVRFRPNEETRIETYRGETRITLRPNEE